MSEYAAYLAMRKWTGFKPPTGPNRCHLCGCHIPSMGHRNGCPEAAD